MQQHDISLEINYIVTPCCPAKHHFETQAFAAPVPCMDYPEVTKTVCIHRDPLSLLCASTWFRPSTRPPAPCPNSSSPKKGCVHISARKVPYSGTVPGHQVWTLSIVRSVGAGSSQMTWSLKHPRPGVHDPEPPCTLYPWVNLCPFFIYLFLEQSSASISRLIRLLSQVSARKIIM